MKTLLLLRHSETDVSDFRLEDHERGITDRGKKDSKQISRWFKETELSIDKLLVSSSNRTRETAKLAFPDFYDNVDFEINLYLCTKEELKNLILQTTDEVSILGIVGHEPSIGMVLKELVGKTRPDLESVLKSDYPTSGLSVIVFNSSSWSKIKDKEGVLDAFYLP